MLPSITPFKNELLSESIFSYKEERNPQDTYQKEYQCSDLIWYSLYTYILLLTLKKVPKFEIKLLAYSTKDSKTYQLPIYTVQYKLEICSNTSKQNFFWEAIFVLQLQVRI